MRFSKTASSHSSFRNRSAQLGRLPVESLQAYLTDQHPQIIAYIVSKLPSDLAARLFVVLPPQLRNAVVQRSLHIGNVAPAAAELRRRTAARPSRS